MGQDLAEDVKKKEEKRRRAKERRARKIDELVSHAVEIPVWAREASDDEGAADGDSGERVTESRRELSWIWITAETSGTDGALEDGTFSINHT